MARSHALSTLRVAVSRSSMEKHSNPRSHHSAKRPSLAQRLLSTSFRRPAIWLFSVLAVITIVASGAASSLLRQLPRQLNPVTLITSRMEQTSVHRAEVRTESPVLPASTTPGTVAPTQTISGRLFDSAGLPITTIRTIKLLQNGTTFGATDTNPSGDYSFTGLTLMSGDKIAAYIVGAAEKGATVTLSGTADIINLDIRQNVLIVRTDNGGSITNFNLKEAEGGVPDPDLTAVSIVDPSNVLSVPTNFTLEIWTGSNYAPGAD